MNKWLTIIIIVFVASIFALIFYTYKVDTKIQEALYNNIRQLSHDTIIAIEINSLESNKKMIIEDQHQIELIQCLIGRADKEDMRTKAGRTKAGRL